MRQRCASQLCNFAYCGHVCGARPSHLLPSHLFHPHIFRMQTVSVLTETYITTYRFYASFLRRLQLQAESASSGACDTPRTPARIERPIGAASGLPSPTDAAAPGTTPADTKGTAETLRSDPCAPSPSDATLPVQASVTREAAPEASHPPAAATHLPSVPDSTTILDTPSNRSSATPIASQPTAASTSTPQKRRRVLDDME